MMTAHVVVVIINMVFLHNFISRGSAKQDIPSTSVMCDHWKILDISFLKTSS